MRYTLLLAFHMFAAFAASTEFTYQGQLKQSGAVAPTATYNMEFKLFDTSTGGTQQGSTVTKNGVAASNGLFVVTLDFGQNVFSGADRYLEVSVNGSALTRQKLTPTPMAIVANKLAEQPKAKIFSGAAQSIPSNGASETMLTFDSEEYDDFGMHTGNSTQIVIPESGVYDIIGTVTLSDTPSAAVREIAIFKNGTKVAQRQEFFATASVSATLEISRHFKLAAGDIIECGVYQSSGSALNTVTDLQHRASLSVSRKP